jgi:anti-sigma regulatory factor (Ser/Thr protein kinase)
MTSQLQTPSLSAAVAAEQTHLQIPSQPEWIAPTVEFLRDRALQCGACPEARARKLTLALHEALTNSVIHGNLEVSSALKERSEDAFVQVLAERSADPRYGSRPVDIRIDYDGECCRWTFIDRGQGFDVERALARAEQAEPETPVASGRGIQLMRAFLDEVRYEAGGRRVVLVLRRPVGEERRRHTRLPLQRPVRVTPIRADGKADWEAAYDGIAQNISADGMSVVQTQPVTTAGVLIGLDWEGQTVHVPAEVRRCEVQGERLVELGCRFHFAPGSPAQEPLPVPGQAAGLQVAQPGTDGEGHDERRVHPRAPYAARIHIQPAAGGTPLMGFARNLSRDGIAFLATQALPLGEVTLFLARAGETDLEVVARVVRCNLLTAGIYDVGARFLDVPNS